VLRKADLRAVVTVQILGYVVAALGGCAILLRKEKLRFSLKKRVMNFVAEVWVENSSWPPSLLISTNAVDQLCFRFFVGPRELGLYVVAVTVFIGVRLFPPSLRPRDPRKRFELPREGAKAVIANSFRTSLAWLAWGCAHSLSSRRG